MVIEATTTDYLTPPKKIVTVDPDGKVEFHNGYTPDEAAKAFWEAIAKQAPSLCCTCKKIDDEVQA